jgi:6-phosphogluconate dehydrogenase
LTSVIPGITNEELAKIFLEWNKGDLDSYLIEITAKIFEKKDEETGKHVLDLILDAAGQKGTGIISFLPSDFLFSFSLTSSFR